MAASARVGRRASGFTSERVRARSRTEAGIVGRRVSGAVRASTTSQPGSVGRRRSTALAIALWPGRQLDDDQLPLRRRARSAAVSTPSGIARSRRGSAPSARSIAASEVPSSASTRARSFARWFLRGGDRDALGGEERRRRRRLRLEQRGRGEAREPGLEAVHDVEGAERERGREVRADADRQRDALGQRRRDGGADRDDVADDAPLQRPAALEQIGARDEGATTVTLWPRRRRASAAPRTCSLTSCGCDHENGVTKQMRSAIVADYRVLAPVDPG